MTARTLCKAFDFTRALAWRRRLLTACLLSALGASAAFSARTGVGVAGRAPSGPPPVPSALAAAFQTPTPTPTQLPMPTWRQPTRPDTTYVCDWKLGGARGMSRLTFEYTRPMPGNAWLGRMNTAYRNGGRRVDKVQFFAPKFTPRLGTQWRLQTTDGKITCNFAVSRLGSEVKFVGCNNGAEQYCVDERLLTTFEGIPGAGCAACRTGSVFEKMSCLARCLSRGGSSGTNQGLCDDTPVKCASFYFANWLSGQGVNWQENFTLVGLADLHQNWVDFVNDSLGRCDPNPYLCPVGTRCGPRGACEMGCNDLGGGVTDGECPNGFKCGGRGTCEKKCTTNATCPDGSYCGVSGTCQKRST